MNNKTLNIAILAIIFYIAAQILADITALRVVLIAGFSIDAGTLVYPITFTLRDVIHKTIGVKIARLTIVSAAIINVLMAFLFWLVAILPPDLDVGEQSEFGFVLAPLFRIVIASIIAEVVSELIDTEVYQLWFVKFKERWQWGRVLSSNAISVPIDSILFVSIAFYGIFPLSVLLSIFLSNMIIKYFMSIVSIPLIYLSKDTQKIEIA